MVIKKRNFILNEIFEYVRIFFLIKRFGKINYFKVEIVVRQRVFDLFFIGKGLCLQFFNIGQFKMIIVKEMKESKECIVI